MVSTYVTRSTVASDTFVQSARATRRIDFAGCQAFAHTCQTQRLDVRYFRRRAVSDDWSRRFF
jgi:hypothetical protein